VSERVAVVGVGVHPFGKSEKSLMDLAVFATSEALNDAGLKWKDVEAVAAASSQFVGGFGWRLAGNELIQAMGESGVAVANLSAACAAGGAAFSSAVGLVQSRAAEVVLVVGAEKMPKGFIARPPGGADDASDVEFLRWVTVGAPNTVYWALEARRRMHEYGTTDLNLAQVAAKAHDVGQHNPRARYRKSVSIDEIMNSPMVSDPLRLYEVCAVSDAAAAVVVCSEAVARRLSVQPIWVRATAVGTGKFGDPTIRIPELSANPVSGVSPVSECTDTAFRAYASAGIDPKDVDLIEVQDNSVWQELAVPELFGLCEPGECDRLLEMGETLPTGRLPVNPSGGFLSFGEATTAMGVWQVCETVLQLRGAAGVRQVPQARLGVCQVLGLEGNGVVTVLEG
jgi:acetyl-CoA acetyltransferase